MGLWDASIGWVTLVVRAPTREVAAELAIRHIESLDLAGAVVSPDITAEWPRELKPDGAPEILVEDLD